MRVIAFSILFWVSFSASPVQAQSGAEKARIRIEAQGFEIYYTGRTWLGRIVFHANNEEFEREIVVDRGSGEILYDVWNDRTTSAFQEKARTGKRSGKANPSESKGGGGGKEKALTDQRDGHGGAVSHDDPPEVGGYGGGEDTREGEGHGESEGEGPGEGEGHGEGEGEGPGEGGGHGEGEGEGPGEGGGHGEGEGDGEGEGHG